MTSQIDFRPEAEREMRSAFVWYEAQQPGLGEAFVSAVESALETISTFPQAAPTVHRNVRRHLLKRFPHSILYLVERGRIVVVAVYHGRRDPGGWKGRG